MAPAVRAGSGSPWQAALAPWLLGAVEHIGSTAVPGLAAKPILDMLAPVADLKVARAAVPVLADLGYRHGNRCSHTRSFSSCPVRHGRGRIWSRRSPVTGKMSSC